MGRKARSEFIGEPCPPFIAELLGLSSYSILGKKCGKENGTWIIAATPRFVCLMCSKCGSFNVKLDSSFKSDFAHIPFGVRKTKLRIYIPRVYCRDCKLPSSPELPQTVDYHRVSADLVEFLLDRYASRQTFAQIEFDSGYTARSAARVIKEAIGAIDEARNKALTLPEEVGIDDIRIFPGPDGIWTHLVNRKTSETIDILPGETGALVQFFLGGLKDVGAVRAYCSDGAAQYIGIGATNFPLAIRTLSKFHAIKYLQEGVADLRHEVSKEQVIQLPDQISKNGGGGGVWGNS